MLIQSISRLLVALIMAVTFATAPISAQEATSQSTFKTEELDQMLAPIALYPDDVLANVLTASTYPLELVQAARWRKEPANAKLEGDALSKALEAKKWDPSVKSLTQFPDVLKLLSDQLEWTQKLGDAFLAQENDVFARIQFLRQKADEAGKLKTTKQQKVTKKPRTTSGSGSERTSSSAPSYPYYYVIEPVDPAVVYIPVYEPSVMYGAWWYPYYPPYYWNWYPGANLVSGIFWGAGFAIANNLWGWGRCDWNRNNINIDVDRFNKINVNRPKITNTNWQHNPAHRGAVPYRDKVSRDKFAKNNKLREAGKDSRGFDKDKVDKSGVDRVKDKLGEGGASKLQDKAGEVSADRVKDKLGEGSKLKDKAGDRGPVVKDRAVDRGQGARDKSRDRPNAASRDVAKSSKPSSRASSKSFDVKPKAHVQQQASRGQASRRSAVSHSGGGGSFAGRGGRGGFGGGGRGGGRRSDIRLKQDIVPLLRLDNGLGLYRFRYKGSDHTAYVGVMAQEVRKIEPSAVWSDRKGYLKVDYERLGVKFMTWKEWLARRNGQPSSLP